MGFFVTLNGDFTCIRCGSVRERSIQTKLLRTDAENSCRPYRVGDTEILDGIDDYLSVCSWQPSDPLSMIVGDWDCSDCQLNWQWANVVFDVSQNGGSLHATITNLTDFQPNHADDLAGVHYVEPNFADLSGAVDRWDALSIQSRCDLTSLGFRNWCVDVAGVEPES